MGFGDNATAVQTFSPSASENVPIWLDNLACNGSEDKLIDCRHNGVGIHNCNHGKDAGVICGGNLPSKCVMLTCLLLYYKNKMYVLGVNPVRSR